MTPDQLLLTPALQAKLTTALANAGQPDGLQVCIDGAAVQIESYTRGYTVDATLIAKWTRLLALLEAYTIAAVGVPKDIKEGADAAIRALEAYRDGKFPGLLSISAPARSAGVAITSDSALDATLS